MSDVDDDFMCEDEEDYGLVSGGLESMQPDNSKTDKNIQLQKCDFGT